mgnify:CR=1 FL=1
MSEAYTFLKECGTFCLITDNNGLPAGRPMETLIQDGNDLVIGVSNNRDIYKQLKNKPRIQLISLNNDTKHWIRVNGLALEDFDEELREKLIESSQFLKLYPDMIQEVAIFKIEVIDYRIY